MYLATRRGYISSYSGPFGLKLHRNVVYSTLSLVFFFFAPGPDEKVPFTHTHRHTHTHTQTHARTHERTRTHTHTNTHTHTHTRTHARTHTHTHAHTHTLHGRESSCVPSKFRDTRKTAGRLCGKTGLYYVLNLKKNDVASILDIIGPLGFFLCSHCGQHITFFDIFRIRNKNNMFSDR